MIDTATRPLVLTDRDSGQEISTVEDLNRWITAAKQEAELIRAAEASELH